MSELKTTIIASGTDSKGRPWEIMERYDGSISVYYVKGGAHMVVWDSLDAMLEKFVNPF